jgi:hypothetical protein
MSDQQKKNLTEEEYLRIHLEGLEKGNQPQQQPEPQFQIPENKAQSINTRVSDLHFFTFDVKEFPCGIFYPAGTTIHIRAAEVKEIQAYSMVDDNNFYDIVEKMNEMLSSCIRIKYIDGTMGSYMELRDPDRYYAIFLIRELTFQQGSNLTTNTTCSCGADCQIELKRENFQNYEINDKIKKYFDPSTNSFRFTTKNGDTYYMAPPTIGLQKSFTEYIIKENAEKKKPNLSFLKIIPFLLYDKNNITLDGIKNKLVEFQKMSDMSFQFLNAAVEKMTFGIERLKKNCTVCGLEVHTEMIFPDGPSAIFVIHDAFDQFIQE